MGFDQRIQWFIIGITIGFIVGYIVRSLREIKRKVEHVEEIVADEEDRKVEEKALEPDKPSKKVGKPDWTMKIGLMVIVLVTAFSAIQSQVASNDVTLTQDLLERNTFCNKKYITETVEALNSRTENNAKQINANKALQEKQAEFWALLLSQPSPPTEKTRAKSRKAAEDYTSSLTHFVEVSNELSSNIVNNPYPTEKELSDCFNQK